MDILNFAFTADHIKNFWNKVQIGNEEECWNWVGRGKTTTPRFSIRQHFIVYYFGAIRLALYFTTNSINETLVITHTCKNKNCCNPLHLIQKIAKKNEVVRYEKCQWCGNDNDGTYGSGRFCKQVCARAFSSLEKREETNIKVSKTLKIAGAIKTQQTAAKYNLSTITKDEKVLVLKICVNCNTSFSISIEHRDQKHCSKECANENSKKRK